MRRGELLLALALSIYSGNRCIAIAQYEKPSSSADNLATTSLRKPVSGERAQTRDASKKRRKSSVQECVDMKAQLADSMPVSEPIASSMPPCGLVIASPGDKRAAVVDSLTVFSDGHPRMIAPCTVQGRPTICLALGGGGVRGGAHIGVLRVFRREGIPIDCIVGNSMGAVIGGLYCAGLPLEVIQRVIEDGSLRRAYCSLVPRKVLIVPLEKVLNPFSRALLRQTVYPVSRSASAPACYERSRHSDSFLRRCHQFARWQSLPHLRR